MKNVIWILCAILLTSVQSANVVFIYPEISPAKPYYFSKYKYLPVKKHETMFKIRKHPYFLRKAFQRKTLQNNVNVSKLYQDELADVSKLETKLKSLLEVEKILKTLINNEKKVAEAEEYAKDASLNEDAMEKEEAEIEEHKLEADVEKNEKRHKEKTREEQREEEDEAMENNEEEQADKEYVKNLRENAKEMAKENMEKAVVEKAQEEEKKYLDEIANEVATKQTEQEQKRKMQNSLASQLNKKSLKEQEELDEEVAEQTEKKRQQIQQSVKEKLEREAQDIASLDQSKHSAKGSCMPSQETKVLNQFIKIHHFPTNQHQNNTHKKLYKSKTTPINKFNENKIFHPPTKNSELSPTQMLV
ncbi:uncharacterized protein LOC128884414 isoform X2 [Hylaeus volcanicus]|uniref:uncharacterized protein LOC128884414 isoform X2 n=1 Tax=Hylaeus volcanicus TaxID=313075 RepID=UPI0023B83CAA|nr:uncharacterized protein LOC128884414 isoform X2 [Hylaeus volcanicus]